MCVCGYLECNSEDEHSEDQRPKCPVSKHLQRQTEDAVSEKISNLTANHFTSKMHSNCTRRGVNMVHRDVFSKESINQTDGRVLRLQHSGEE